MGGTAWSDNHYRERAALRACTGDTAFAYDRDISEGRAAGKVHEKMDPRGVTVRESRDSEAHPASHAVGILMDVTGSMRQVPSILQANLPKLMGLLIREGYLDHPQILIGGIGDALNAAGDDDSARQPAYCSAPTVALNATEFHRRGHHGA